MMPSVYVDRRVRCGVYHFQPIGVAKPKSAN